MSKLENKHDFAVVIKVNKANPNGDPLTGNMPRIDYDGKGLITDVCLKRKIRNSLLELGNPIFVQSDTNKTDAYNSLYERLKGEIPPEIRADQERLVKTACEKWIDVRAFGSLFAFKGGTDSPVSIGIQEPVSIQHAESLNTINILSLQITKSVNGESSEKVRASDTMGMKHIVDHAVYVAYGSINPIIAEKTGFQEEDVETIKKAILYMFMSDASSARPSGSIEVRKLIWWKHNNKIGVQSSASVHRSLHIDAETGEVFVDELDHISCEIIDGKS